MKQHWFVFIASVEPIVDGAKPQAMGKILSYDEETARPLFQKLCDKRQLAITSFERSIGPCDESGADTVIAMLSNDRRKAFLGTWPEMDFEEWRYFLFLFETHTDVASSPQRWAMRFMARNEETAKMLFRPLARDISLFNPKVAIDYPQAFKLTIESFPTKDNLDARMRAIVDEDEKIMLLPKDPERFFAEDGSKNTLLRR